MLVFRDVCASVKWRKRKVQNRRDEREREREREKFSENVEREKKVSFQGFLLKKMTLVRSYTNIHKTYG